MSTDSWDKICGRHEASLRTFVDLANSLDENLWAIPIAEGKWTPIEITEHLRAAYEMALKELEGGKGFRVRTGILTRTFARLVYLPRIVRNRRMPEGIKAPGEIRPTNCIEDRTDALIALQDLGTRVQSELGRRRNDPTAFLTHHLLGKFRPNQAMDFITIHLEHHTRQLPNFHE